MSYASEQGILNAQYNAAVLAQQAEEFRMRPSWHLRPRVFPDGGQWCALYGNNLQEGVAGFGSTPEEALGEFDIAWKSLSPPPRRKSPTQDIDVTALVDSLMEKERDARRYRWLRAAPPESLRWPIWRLGCLSDGIWKYPKGTDLDEALDRCMRRELVDFVTANV